MKTLTRRITVFVVVSLMIAGFASAQVVETPIAPVAPLPAPTPPSPPDIKAIETAEKEIHKHAAQIDAKNKAFSELMTGLSHVNLKGILPHGGTGTVLVIPTGEITTEDLLTITEDMNVMSRIFERNLQSADIATVGGSLFTSGREMFTGFFTRHRQTIQSIYLQGYGALFLMKVDFPLSPPPVVPEEEKETKGEDEDVDPVWEEIKREMREPEEARRRGPERPEKEYDAEDVENLKTTLIKALKHAANIRGMKPDESVILTTIGSGESADLAKIVVSRNVVVGKGASRIIETPISEDTGFPSPTVLVIRVKKSDIDAFAKGDLDVDQFSQKTQIVTYPLLGENIGSTSSLSVTVPTLRSSGR